MKGHFTEEERRAQRYLEQATDVMELLKNAEDALEEISQRAMPKGIAYDNVRVQTSTDNSQEMLMVLAMEEKKKYNEMRDRYAKTMREILEVIRKVGQQDATAGRILTLRYIKGEANKIIQEELHYSKRAFYYRYHDAHRITAAVLKESIEVH